MEIVRNAHVEERAAASFLLSSPGSRPAVPRSDCLGCKKCSGICAQVLELIAVPEIVQKRS